MNTTKSDIFPSVELDALPPRPGTRVLVVDDSEENQYLLSLLLGKKGFEVEVASDGVQGVKKAMAENFDVILMDIEMPILDGYGAAKSLREKGNLVPIIALTAHSQKQDREKSGAAGCDAHVVKPFDYKDLIQTIVSLVGRAPTRH